MTIVKNLKIDFNRYYRFYYTTNTFDSHIFDNEAKAFLIFFFKFAPKCILFLRFFLNERNIAISILMIHLKYTAVHNANINSGSINRLKITGR